MCYGAQATILHLCRIERHAVLGEFEPLLDEGGEFADTAALFSKDFLGMRGANDDVCDGGRDADFDTRIALFGEFALEELVQLGVENAIYDRRVVSVRTEEPKT